MYTLRMHHPLEMKNEGAGVVSQEARALGELEEKLRSSRQVLSSKEQDLRELNSFLTQVNYWKANC